MQASAPERAAVPSRHEGLDAVRAAALFLGVAYHATWAYMPDIGPWYVIQDSRTAAWMAPFAATLQALRMPVFLALAGFFARRSVLRRGATATLRDRLRRLGWPLLVGVPLVVAVDLWSRRWAEAWGVLHPAYAGGTAPLARPLHLWFLEYLLLFVATACAVDALVERKGVPAARRAGRDDRLARLAVAASHRPSRQGCEADHPTRRLGSLAWVAAGLPAGLLRWWLGEPTPAFSFVPQLATVAHFAPFFAYGWWLGARQPGTSSVVGDTLSRSWVRWRRWLAAAAAGAGVCAAAVAASSALAGRPLGPVLAVAAAWLAVPGFLELGLSLPRVGGRWLRAAADASFWVYLVHYPLVLAGQLALTRVAWPAELKWLTLTTLVTACSGLSFALLVRGTRLEALLGGRGAAPARAAALEATTAVRPYRASEPLRVGAPKDLAASD